jgi:hypothetical protein
MEPAWLLTDIWTVNRRALGVVLAATGVFSLGWDGIALLVGVLAGQHWDAGTILTVLGMFIGGLAGLGLAWLVWPHPAPLDWPARWLHRHDRLRPPTPPPAPPLPTSPRPKFSELARRLSAPLHRKGSIRSSSHRGPAVVTPGGAGRPR